MQFDNGGLLSTEPPAVSLDSTATISRGRECKNQVFVWLAVIANTAGNFLLSFGIHRMDFSPSASPIEYLRIFANPWIDAGVMLLIVWFASQLSLLSWADLSYVIPVTSASYVLTAFLGKVFLHETVSIGRWAGIFVISVGVMLVMGTSPQAKIRSRRNSMNAWLLIMVSILSGTAGDLLTAKSMRDHGEISDFRFSAVAGVGVRLARDFAMITGVLAQAVSFFSFVALLGVAELSFAVPATAFGNVVKTLFAKIFLNEHVSRRRWAGAILVACGVYLVSL